MINRKEIIQSISDIYIEKIKSENSFVSTLFIENEDFVISKLEKTIEKNIVVIENIILGINNFSYYIDINKFKIECLYEDDIRGIQYFFNDKTNNPHLSSFELKSMPNLFVLSIGEFFENELNNNIIYKRLYTMIYEKNEFEKIVDNITKSSIFYNGFEVVGLDNINICDLPDLEKSIKIFIKNYVKNNKKISLEYLKYSEFIFELMECSQIIIENRNYIRKILNNNYIIKLKKEDFDILEIQYDISKETINEIFFSIHKTQENLKKINVTQ